MDIDFGVLLGYKAALLKGLLTTLELTSVSIMFGVSLGFLLGVLRSYGNGFARAVTTGYVELFRGTPVLVQLFWIFFCLPLFIGVELSNFTSGVLALSLYMGAVSSETFRSSLKSIGSEQFDACVALGLPRHVQLAHVVLPQAVLRAVPTLLSNCVSLFKESSLVSAVGLADLMFVGQNISSNIARPFEVLTAVAFIYFLVAFPLTRAVTNLEGRMLARLDM